MLYQVIQPAPQLRAFVKEYLLLHFMFDKNKPFPIKPFPCRPQHTLCFYLRGGIIAANQQNDSLIKYPKIAINGSQLNRFDFYFFEPEYLLFSVDFQPGALSKFLKIPMNEDFIDNRIDAETILNPEIEPIYQQMLNAVSYESIIQITETYLWKRIQSLKSDFQKFDQVSHIIAANPSIFSIEQLASDACLSISQFERRFTQQMGITPKLFARINRYHQAFLLKDQNPNLDWLSIALQTGYNDYQHMVKDFKQFSGTTPNSLLQAQSQAPERVLGITTTVFVG